METDEQLQMLTAKVLMLETIQTSICTFLAAHHLGPDGFVDKVFDDAENELRVMAIARNGSHAGLQPLRRSRPRLSCRERERP